MSLVFRWSLLIGLLINVPARNADIITSEDGSSKWLYHEKSKQVYSIGNNTPEALFGYSIAYQQQIRSLIVGCPNESQIGRVYKCAMEDVNRKCQPFQNPAQLLKMEHPHNLWLGANVNTGTSFLMACAPRTVNKIGEFTGVYGSCFYQNYLLLDKLEPMKTISPHDKERDDYHAEVYYGLDQLSTSEIKSDTFGWSSYVTDDGNIFVGGPGMSVGRTMWYPNVYGNPQHIKVDNKKLGDRRVALNFGYSITSGLFMPEEEGYTEIIAIGSPYGTIGFGEVFFYEYSGSTSDYIQKNMFIKGSQVGSLFAAALCAVRDRDGRSALLVGAPAYAPGGSSSNYDTGVVYIYNFTVDNDDEDIQPLLVREVPGHSCSGGYFGAAIVSIGDFDSDGIDEVAIGAPYESDGRGTVYIYSGELLLSNPQRSEVKLGDKPYLQRILPENRPNQYFGWALNSPADSDDNGCRELAIGAPGGNHVTLLRCMASVKIAFDVKFPDLKDQAKALAEKDAFFTFTPCLNVTYPDKPDPSKLETAIIFENKILHHGATLKGAKELKISLATSKRFEKLCYNVQVQLPKDADYDEDITFTMTAKLEQSQNPLQSSTFNPKLVLLNGTTTLSKNFTVPSLPGSEISFDMNTSLKDGYVIGSTTNETLSFSIGNSASTAYGVCVRARIAGARISAPPPRICSYSAEKLRCMTSTIQKGKSWDFSVTLDTKGMTSANEKLEIYAEILTRNCSKPTGKNLTRTLDLISDHRINITGYAPDVRITREELHSERGKSLEHIYSIINFGLTTWDNIQCNVAVPSGFTKIEVYILYDDFKSQNCAINETQHAATCVIKESKKNHQIEMRVKMDVGSNDAIAAHLLKGKSTVVNSSVVLTLGKGEVREKSLSKKIEIWEAQGVPVWIIVVAGLVGLLIVVLICWALHECGFLRRDKKQKLEELKENVKRQSMRRSQMLRQSTIEVLRDQKNPSDRQMLVGLPEEEDGSLEDQENRDPARAAFEKELAKALCKNKSTNVQN